MQSRQRSSWPVFSMKSSAMIQDVEALRCKPKNFAIFVLCDLINLLIQVIPIDWKFSTMLQEAAVFPREREHFTIKEGHSGRWCREPRYFGLF